MISKDYKVKFQDSGIFTLREIEGTDQAAPGALKNEALGGNLEGRDIQMWNYSVRNRHLVPIFFWTLNLASSTYKCSGKGTIKNYSLRVEMTHPNSIYKKHIETFSVIGKQRRYSSSVAIMKSIFQMHSKVKSLWGDFLFHLLIFFP
jgi:hypothetical protein